MGKPSICRNRIGEGAVKVPQYCCSVKGCRKYFSKLSRLKYHENTHLAEKPFKCDYEGCTCAYYRPNHLKRHLESIHSHSSDLILPKDYKCDHEGCQAAFESEASLYYHKKRKHSVQPFECSFCDRKFLKKWMIKEHEAGHTGSHPFKCDKEECGKDFKDFRLFKAHKRSHEKKTERVLMCEECKLRFNKWSELVNHKKLCHTTESLCPVCKKTFSTKQYLKLHVQVHEEDRATFMCPIEGCPRFYLHPRNLSHHMRIKHEDQGFECPKCKRKLSSKQKLDYHVKIMHEGKTNHKKRKAQKSAEEVLKKIAPIKEEDWEVKRRGPLRYKREKSHGIIFPTSLSSEYKDGLEEKCQVEVAEDVLKEESTVLQGEKMTELE
ncbi:unnamed protein product [Orchesella dallaii]|uniref:C2H2-type domain-containing protein n=1 Tax=Orchesella dallaii TaxID=48710 RepID=A0ABP1PVW5_9HEXA